MRTLIHILVAIMGLLIVNIIAYSLSEDYRFFLKKLKYQEEVVYDSQVSVDDTNRMEVIDTTPEKVIETQTIQTSGTGFTFLDVLSGKKDISWEEASVKLTPEHLQFLDLFEAFDIKQTSSQESLFGLTWEYPDTYYEFEGEDIVVYVFPTKTYSEVLKIFRVLEYEAPFTLNETGSFGEASFFINLDTAFSDDSVRIVLESGKKLFWLKIKKDTYNTIKEILNSL